MVNARTREITVNVTQKDIMKGRPSYSAFCPVAYAIRRALRYKYQVSVGCTKIQIGKRRLARDIFPTWLEVMYLASLPKVAHDFILDFDYTSQLGDGAMLPGPISFTLTLERA